MTHGGASAEILTLDDGRTMAYSQLGDADGAPVLSCHGGLSSRLDVLPAHDAAAALGVRIISPDRPGIGRSQRAEGHTLVDWPADVAQLADHLGLDRFGVLGWSLGGIYAQAVAHALPAHVTSLALVASSIPADWDGMTDEINRMDQRFMRLAEHHPGIERTIFHLLHGAAHRAPKAFAEQMGMEGAAGSAATTAIAEGLSDVRGVVDDYKVMAAPWGFSPGDIAVPTRIWQGDADDLVPPAWADRLAAAIPGAEVTVVPGAGHFLWYDHWGEILAWLHQRA